MYKNFLCTSIMGHTLSVILRHTLHVIHGCALKGILNHLFNVILGFIPRIHTKQNLNCHTRAWLLARPEDLDSRVTPEYDGDLMVDTRDRLSVTPEYDNKKRMCLKPENDHKRSLIKGLDVVCQCAALLERRVQSSTRVRKAQAVTRQTNPIGRSMIEMLGVLAIIGVLSVGGIQGYSKAMETYKINKTKRQITEIITNIQTLYMQQKDFNGLSNTTAVQMGIVPDDLKTSRNGDYTDITNAFGSPVGILGREKSFYINFLDVTKEGCIALATADWGNSASGLVAINIGFMSGRSDGFLEYYSPKGCTDIGHRDGYGYRACANHLPLSPALAAQHCDTNSDWGYDNSFGIKFSK